MKSDSELSQVRLNVFWQICKLQDNKRYVFSNKNHWISVTNKYNLQFKYTETGPDRLELAMI